MRIAIIGGGFSGCQLTLELLRRARPGTQILLFDGAATFGRGIAFAARDDRLLLNVRVANMSAFEDDRSHFLRWLWANDLPGHSTDPIPPSGHAFVPRGLYGRYLSELLDEAAAALPSGVSAPIGTPSGRRPWQARRKQYRMVRAATKAKKRTSTAPRMSASPTARVPARTNDGAVRCCRPG
jgi:hypothetical protein